MTKFQRVSILRAFIIALIGVGANLASSQVAYASTDHELNFTFGGPGRNPSVSTMHNYIMGCLPNGSRIYAGDPAESAGPWTVEVAAVKGHEYDNAEIETVLMGQSCAPVRPQKVIAVVSTDD